MNQNYNSVSPTLPVKTSTNYNLFIFICMAVVVVGCLFPFLSVSIFGVTESTNYLYYDGNFKDGIFVIGALIIALIGIFKNNYKLAMFFILAGIAVFIYDVVDTLNLMKEYDTWIEDAISFGVGAYIVGAGLVGAFISTFLANKNKPAIAPINNVVPTPVAGYVQPNGYINQPQPNNFVNPTPTVNNAFVNNQQQFQTVASCPYCGSPRNEGAFCKSCGGKY